MDNNAENDFPTQLANASGLHILDVIDAENGVAAAVTLCSTLAVKSGWWNRRAPNVPNECRTAVAAALERCGFALGGLLTAEEIAGMVPEKLCLSHSELSEAMEGHRKGLKDDKLPHRSMLEVELADAVIRIFDLAGALGLDLSGAMIEKLAYNQQRADHKPEARAAAGGKAY